MRQFRNRLFPACAITRDLFLPDVGLFEMHVRTLTLGRKLHSTHCLPRRRRAPRKYQPRRRRYLSIRAYKSIRRAVWREHVDCERAAYANVQLNMLAYESFGTEPCGEPFGLRPGFEHKFRRCIERALDFDCPAHRFNRAFGSRPPWSRVSSSRSKDSDQKAEKNSNQPLAACRASREMAHQRRRPSRLIRIKPALSSTRV